MLSLPPDALFSFDVWKLEMSMWFSSKSLFESSDSLALFDDECSLNPLPIVCNSTSISLKSDGDGVLSFSSLSLDDFCFSGNLFGFSLKI